MPFRSWSFGDHNNCTKFDVHAMFAYEAWLSCRGSNRRQDQDLVLVRSPFARTSDDLEAIAPSAPLESESQQQMKRHSEVNNLFISSVSVGDVPVASGSAWQMSEIGR